MARQRQELQQKEWNLERLKEEREGLIEEQRSGAIRLQEMEQALPEPRPEIPEAIRIAGLEALQADLQAIQRRMEALEPVNMLALEELQALEERLAELNERLDREKQLKTWMRDMEMHTQAMVRAFLATAAYMPLTNYAPASTFK